MFPREEVLGCRPIAEELVRALGSRPGFRYRLGDRRHWATVHVPPEPGRAAVLLDRVRRNTPKFITLNNRFTGAPADSVQRVARLLQDLLKALFPRPSQFERTNIHSDSRLLSRK